MELSYENVPAQQCPKAGVEPEGWSEEEQKDKKREHMKGGKRKNVKVETRAERVQKPSKDGN